MVRSEHDLTQGWSAAGACASADRGEALESASSNSHGWLRHAGGAVLPGPPCNWREGAEDPGHLRGARPVSAEAQKLHFLVVDDNEEIRDVFCRLVQRAGHLASIARDGL